MKKIIGIFCFIATSQTVFIENSQAYNFAEPFAQSFNQDLFQLNFSRFNSTADQVFLAKPSLLERWGIINNDAAASYNSTINTIVLNQNIIQTDTFGFRLPTIAELKKSPVAWVYTIGQIFHEMGHAEYDVFVEERKTPEDEALMQVMQGEVRQWIAKKYPRLSNSDNTLAQWELFGYYRGDLINEMIQGFADILVLNGLDPVTGKCQQWPSLKKLAKTMPLEQFLAVLPIGTGFDDRYRENFKIASVFIGGEEISFVATDFAPLSKNVFISLWDHFSAFYKLPVNKRAIIELMNNNITLRKKVQTCHREIFLAAQFLSASKMLELDAAEDWHIDWPQQ